MHGVVSLLDDQHTRLTLELWEELRRDFGLQGAFVTPYPHFSYHVAHGYRWSDVELALSALAEQLPAFTVETAGLGVFSSPRPVLYLPVVRTRALSVVHEAVWHAVQPLCEGALAYYAPEHWVPHITLTMGDLRPDRLAPVMERLGSRTFSWEIAIRSLDVIEDDPAGQRLRSQIALPAAR